MLNNLIRFLSLILFNVLFFIPLLLANSSLMYGLLEKVNNDGLIQENKRSNEKVHNMNEYYEETSTVAVSAESGDHPPGFSQNPEENLDALSSSSMTDSWIMIDYNGLNPDGTYSQLT